MRIGVPTEIKDNESRVALAASGVMELTSRGHEVFVQSGAGEGSFISDEDYAAAGATIVPSADEAWANAELVLKVKEPLADEYHLLRDDMTLFTYLHLAADRPQAEALVRARTTALAYETVQLPDGLLPLLYPMSEVAGSLAPLVGAQMLMRPHGGRGVLMGGVGGVHNSKVVIIGAGTAGQNAANIAAGMGANVVILDTDLKKLRATFWRFSNLVQNVLSTSMTIREELKDADLVIGTVLVPGSKAPKLVTNDMVAQMKPGSVLVDVAIDQGGCFEDSRPTTHSDPTYKVHGSTFYCVGNMPAAVPVTSTLALTNATLPYVLRLADHGWREASRRDPALALGINTHDGRLVFDGVKAAFPDLPSSDLADIL